MAIKRYTLGPGTLTLGSGPLDVSGQVRSCRVAWSENVSTTEAIPVLSGEEIAATSTETFDATLTGSLIQDIDAAGVVDWSWTNRGTEQAFRFVPSTAEGREVEGILKPVPLDLGGDVVTTDGEGGEPPSSDFTWRIVGVPTFGAVGP